MKRFVLKFGYFELYDFGLRIVKSEYIFKCVSLFCIFVVDILQHEKNLGEIVGLCKFKLFSGWKTTTSQYHVDTTFLRLRVLCLLEEVGFSTDSYNCICATILVTTLALSQDSTLKAHINKIYYRAAAEGSEVEVTSMLRGRNTFY